MPRLNLLHTLTAVFVLSSCVSEQVQPVQRHICWYKYSVFDLSIIQYKSSVLNKCTFSTPVFWHLCSVFPSALLDTASQPKPCDVRLLHQFYWLGWTVPTMDLLWSEVKLSRPASKRAAVMSRNSSQPATCSRIPLKKHTQLMSMFGYT